MSKNNVDTEVDYSKRYRNFMILLYDESKFYKFDEVMKNIKGIKLWAYIRHSPESDEKQYHYHVFVRLDSATTITALSKRLGVPPNYIEYVRNVRSACRYLIHFDDEDKIQYNLSDVVVSRSFERKFKLNFEDLKSDEDIIQDIYFWLDNTHFDTYFEKMKYFTMFINLNCYDTIFKRYRFEFIDYLKHNL